MVFAKVLVRPLLLVGVISARTDEDVARGVFMRRWAGRWSLAVFRSRRAADDGNILLKPRDGEW